MCRWHALCHYPEASKDDLLETRPTRRRNNRRPRWISRPAPDAEEEVMFGLDGIVEIVKVWKRPPPPQWRLVPLDGRRQGAPIIARLPAVLGRSHEADVRLQDPWVSRIHCELFLRDGEARVRDLESRHGVYVNDQRVSDAALHPGDVLSLGVSRFRVEGAEEPPAPAQTSNEAERDSADCSAS
jgi:FHA domain